MPSPTPQLPRPSTPDAAARGLRPGQIAALAASADALLILLFAAIGRDAHQRAENVTGVLATAWPFLAGAAVAWLALRLWRAPLRLWPAGVAVWLGTVGVGMALRAVTGQTVVLPFIIVALLSLAVFLLGYRLVVAGVRRLRSRRGQA
jgi:peptidoglycan/LPS O-acetylase OafA/YrhL